MLSLAFDRQATVAKLCFARVRGGADKCEVYSSNSLGELPFYKSTDLPHGLVPRSYPQEERVWSRLTDPLESAKCHQTLSLQVGSGHEVR